MKIKIALVSFATAILLTGCSFTGHGAFTEDISQLKDKDNKNINLNNSCFRFTI